MQQTNRSLSYPCLHIKPADVCRLSQCRPAQFWHLSQPGAHAAWLLVHMCRTSMVYVVRLTAVNTFPGLAHTARHTTGVGPAQSQISTRLKNSFE